MKTKTILAIERLEERTLASATATLAQGYLSIATDNATNYLVLSTPAPGVTELFDGVANKTTDFTGVKGVFFTAGAGNNTFYQNTTLPSVLTAGNGASTYILTATAGINFLIASTNPNSRSFLTAPGNGQNFLSGNTAGEVNIFGGGSDNVRITNATKVELYDIVGASTIVVIDTPGYGVTTRGYALVNATDPLVQVASNMQVVTFFQAKFQGTQTQAAAVQADVNGNNILYLNPLNPTANVSYVVNQYEVDGRTITQVSYLDSAGASQNLEFTQSISWVSFFSITGVSRVTVNAPINTVLYGKSGSVLIGGPGQFDVLKIHSGSGAALGRAAVNDLFAGAAGATAGATLIKNNGSAIFRNATDKISTTDYGNFGRADVILGVPANIDGYLEPNVGKAALNIDFEMLYLWERSLGLI